jgi:hypothetical protein
MFGKTVINNSTVGIVQGRDSRNSGDVDMRVGVTGDDLVGILQSLMSALPAEPAVPATVVAELDQLIETAKTEGDTPLKPDFFARLKVAAATIAAAAGLGKATSDVLDALRAFGVL